MSKRLSEPDLKHITLQQEAGKSLEQIALELAEEGYVTAKGNPVKGHDLSNFKMGYRRRNGEAPNRRMGVQPEATSLVDDVEELMSCTLNKRLKDRFLRVLMQEG